MKGKITRRDFLRAATIGAAAAAVPGARNEPGGASPGCVATVPIDPNGRYVMVANGIDVDAWLDFAEQVREWWASDDPIFLVGALDGADVRLVKVGDWEATGGG